MGNWEKMANTGHIKVHIFMLHYFLETTMRCAEFIIGGVIVSHIRKALGFIIAVLTALLLLFCCSCSSDNDNDIEPDSQAYAYLEVFINIVGDIEEDRIEYIGIDTTGIMYKRPSEIRRLFEDYANNYGVSIRWNTKKSKCDYDFFSKGWLIIFEDIELTETKLETGATWMGAVALASANETYTVEKEAGVWTITDNKFNWIS